MATANRYIIASNGSFYLVPSDSELYHHGVKGMKWGVRRYQNADGSLTAAGKKRAAKLSEKLDESRLEARVRYNIATRSANESRAAEKRKDRNAYKQAGIRQMDRAYDLDKKIAKIEKKMRNIGVDPKKDQNLVDARTQAGKNYVKRSKGAIAADVIGQGAANVGAVFAQKMLGSPILFAWWTPVNKHKLKKTDD